MLKVQEQFGVAQSYRGLFPEAEEILRSTRECMRELLPENHEYLLNISRNLALVIWETGNQAEALAVSQAALQAWVRTIGTQNRGYFEHLNDYALLCYNGEDVIQADRSMHTVVRGFQEILGNDHDVTLVARQNHARMAATLGRLEEAEQTLRDVAAAWTRLHGARNPLTLTAQHALGQTLMRLGRNDEAQSILIDTLRTREDVLGPGHPHTVQTRDVAQWCRAANAGIW